ncbi:tsaA [Symbiodinium necroappetens]|uniref:TsaA protein n=1 Tax=Symbiodinium necroappetens TaxID=1628268 RepID=A0A812YLT4_9DINO|nr:tsaA [Symbiodinium necroappetens]
MPLGAVNITFSSPAQFMTHFLNVCHNVAKTDLDIDNLKGMFKNEFWSDLPVLMKLQENPSFEYKTQHFIQKQSTGNYTIIKHVCLTKQKLTQTKLESFAVGKLYEIAWGHGNKVVERKALQWNCFVL